MGSCTQKQSVLTQRKGPRVEFINNFRRFKDPQRIRMNIAITIFKAKDLKTPILILRENPLYQDRLKRFLPILSS